MDALCKYFGSLSPDINKNNIIIASFACHQAITITSCECGRTEDCACKIETKTRDRVRPNPAPVIQTQAGEVSRLWDSLFGNSNINLKFDSLEKIRKVNCNISENESEVFMNPTPIQRTDFLLAGADPGNDSDEDGIADGGYTHYCENKNGIADGNHVFPCGVHKPYL